MVFFSRRTLPLVFPADNLDVLLVEGSAAQLFAAVLIGGYAGHDGVGGRRESSACAWLNEDSEEDDRHNS